MKRITTILIFIVSAQMSPQAAMVNDIMANKTLASQLASSSKQLVQLEKNYELLKTSEEKYQKINSIVTSVYSLGEIIELQREAIKNVQLVLDRTKLTGARRTDLMNVMNKTLVHIAKRAEIIGTVLQGGFFNMSDKERIDMFQQERGSIFIFVTKTRVYANPYRDRN